MEFQELARRRCSVRAYTKEPVSAAALQTILEAAHAAPTAANRQPVRLLAAQGEGLAKLARAANLYGAPLAILACADRSRAWVRPFDGRSSAEVDAAILTDHMMLQAADLGLGSVWIGYFDPAAVREAFALPDSMDPISILAVGHPAGPLASPERHGEARIPMEELVFYEEF